jgi:uncharacterized membrane protein
MSSAKPGATRLASLAYCALRGTGEGVSPTAARAWRIALSLWLAAMIATPVALWSLGPSAFAPMATLGVLAHTAASSTPLVTHWGWRRWLELFLPLLALVWLLEWIGVAMGWPFGEYHYTIALQPQLLSIPLTVALAWAMMLIPSWAVGAAIVGDTTGRLSWKAAVVAAAAFTAWDLYLDPQMVARGLWVWEQPGVYFGVPWVNYAGWFAASLALGLILRPRDLPRLPLLVIYALTWLFQGLALGLFWGQPGPALCGLMGMGIFAVLAWRAETLR